MGDLLIMRCLGIKAITTPLPRVSHRAPLPAAGTASVPALLLLMQPLRAPIRGVRRVAAREIFSIRALMKRPYAQMRVLAPRTRGGHARNDPRLAVEE